VKGMKGKQKGKRTPGGEEEERPKGEGSPLRAPKNRGVRALSFCGPPLRPDGKLYSWPKVRLCLDGSRLLSSVQSRASPSWAPVFWPLRGERFVRTLLLYPMSPFFAIRHSPFAIPWRRPEIESVPERDPGRHCTLPCPGYGGRSLWVFGSSGHTLHANPTCTRGLSPRVTT
jgi:hypothetical protein